MQKRDGGERDQFPEHIKRCSIWISDFCTELLDLKILDSKSHHQQDRFLSKSFATAELEEVR